MDPIIVAALIAAAATMLAVLFRHRLSQRRGAHERTLRQDQLPPAEATDVSLEERLRADNRVRRLLENRNWQGAAEAAIAFLVRGEECSVKTWRDSSTWVQVEMVHRELVGGHSKK
jgi:hypothetical protein